MRSRFTRLPALLLAASLALTGAACGDDDDAQPSAASPDTGTGGEFPVTIEAGNGSVTVDERPTRIVSLSPTATEMLFAVGAGDQVVAVDNFSNYPESAPMTDLNALEPNLEAIAGYEPDLVIIANPDEELEAGLEALDVTLVVEPAATVLDDTYDQIADLGAATGHESEAEALNDEIRTEIDEIVSALPDRDEPLTYYHELDDLYFTVTSNTFIGQLYSLVGLENIADAAEAGNDYPQLTAEYLVASDPDLIFLADTKCCEQNLQTVAARPGFDQLTAVQQGNVIELDDDIASRWGPRVVDYLRTVVEAVSTG